MTIALEGLGCRTCGAVAGRFDLWCGACGTALAQLRWRGENRDRWLHGNDKLAVQPDTQLVSITFSNAGIVPVGLVLRSATVGELPRWLDGSKWAEQLIIVPAGVNNEVTIELPVRGAELRRIFGGGLFDRDRDPTQDGVQLEARLCFVTTLGERRDDICRARTLEACLLVAKEPWLVPGRSLYRFLPVERLRREGFEHRIELRNEAAEDIELTSIDVVEDLYARAPGNGRTRISGAQLIACDERQLPVRVEAGARFETDLRLSLEETLPAGLVGWFSSWVEFTFERSGRPGAARALIRGQVGRGPSVELDGCSTGIDSGRLLFVLKERLSEPHWITLRNPGDLPVRILRVDRLLRESGEDAASGRDWLELRGIDPNDVLGPGEQRMVRLGLRPERRPQDESANEESYRRIRFLHDGWQQDEADRIVEITLGVQFGRVEEAVAGIDFGTSNSMVCVASEGSTHPVVLEFGDQQSTTLASLMFYDAEARASRQGFLYGDTAYSSARINPANLVRSIKTVVSRRPDADYIFLDRGPAEQPPLVRRSARELLNLFIDELRRRGERGVSMLSPDARNELNLDTASVVFRRAVFTHPVEISPEMKEALMQAAHAAGINEHLPDVDQFFEQSCVDEATAAVLAYVDSLVALENCSDHEVDRLICFDMGGGTTDIAAVEVVALRAYIEGRAKKVQVKEMAKVGDSRFGGDELDQLLAKRIVNDIVRLSKEWALDPLLDELDYALEADTLSRFVDGFRTRRLLRQQIADPDCFDDALQVFNRAAEVLRSAEAAKRMLSDSATVHISLTSSPWFSAGTKPKDNFEIDLRREDFDADVRAKLEPRLGRLDEVVRSAGWTWDQVTTLLFTGQSVRTPIVRELVKERATSGRSDKALPIVFVEPGGRNGFDPKECVAKGAAVWGENWLQAGSNWLTITSRMKDVLTYDLQTRQARRYLTVDGLSAGTPLPARATFEFPVPMDRILLYRGKERCVQFRFPLTTKAEVVVEGPGEFWVLVDGRRIRGEVNQ